MTLPHIRPTNWLAYLVAGLLGSSIAVMGMATGGEDELHQKQQGLLKQIQNDAARTAPFSGVKRIDLRVMQAMANVPRHQYVDDAFTRVAYLNQPLPIGHGQTISQPFIVALMTHLAQVEDGHKVLEIGTGSGYQAAVLAELAKQVVTIEIIPELAEQATQRLKAHGYSNIQVEYADGSFGWEDGAPYDAIIVTAASETVPKALLQQLAAPGKMVIPIGEQDGGQELFVYTKDDTGKVTRRSHLPVSFVPFTGAQSKHH